MGGRELERENGTDAREVVIPFIDRDDRIDRVLIRDLVDFHATIAARRCLVQYRRKCNAGQITFVIACFMQFLRKERTRAQLTVEMIHQ